MDDSREATIYVAHEGYSDISSEEGSDASSAASSCFGGSAEAEAVYDALSEQAWAEAEQMVAVMPAVCHEVGTEEQMHVDAHG